MKMKFKRSIFVVSLLLASASAIFTTPSRDEILEEIAFIRKKNESLRLNFNHNARNLMDEISENKVLEQASSRWDYWTKYLTFWHPVSILKYSGVSMILLTKENAPKTYEIIEEMATKTGLTSIPLVYLLSNKSVLNAFASGLLHSMSIIVLGEELLKDLTTIEDIRFLIAHEMTHIKKRHTLKTALFTVTLRFVIDQIYEKLPQKHRFYGYNIPLVGYISLNQTILNLSYIATLTYLMRYFEHEADLGAAQATGIDAGIHFLNIGADRLELNARIDDDFKALQEAIENSNLKDARWYNLRVKMTYIYSKISHIIDQFFSTHPMPQKRIAYLEKMIHEQEVAAQKTNAA